MSVICRPKSRSSIRAVPVDASVIAALHEHRRRQDERRSTLGATWHDHDLVFASEVGTPIGPRNLSRDFEKWVARASVPAIRIHDIRHTVVTEAIAAGLPIKAVSEHMGHADTAITMNVYTHVRPRQRVEVAKKIGQTFLGEAPENQE